MVACVSSLGASLFGTLMFIAMFIIAVTVIGIAFKSGFRLFGSGR